MTVAGVTPHRERAEWAARPAPPTPGEQLVAEYVEALRRAAAELPAADRVDLLEGTRARIRAAVGDGAGDETQVRGVLAALGRPERLANTRALDTPTPRPTRRARGELALVLGSFGGMLAVLASAIPPR